MTNTASFSFDPIVITAEQGDILTVDILMYSGTDPVVSSDVWVSYNPDFLTPITEGDYDMKPGNFFQITDVKIFSPGKIYLYAINQSPTASDTTNGRLASVSFKAQKKGTTELRFDCMPFQKQTSQIIRQDPEFTNIINCASTRSHTSVITIDQGGVLGASTQNSNQTIYIGLAILFALLVGLLLLRYTRLSKTLKTS